MCWKTLHAGTAYQHVFSLRTQNWKQIVWMLKLKHPPSLFNVLQVQHAARNVDVRVSLVNMCSERVPTGPDSSCRCSGFQCVHISISTLAYKYPHVLTHKHAHTLDVWQWIDYINKGGCWWTHETGSLSTTKKLGIKYGCASNDQLECRAAATVWWILLLVKYRKHCCRVSETNIYWTIDYRCRADSLANSVILKYHVAGITSVDFACIRSYTVEPRYGPPLCSRGLN